MNAVKTIEPNGTSGRFPDYHGKKVFEVKYGGKTAHVYAPDEDAAIFAAAFFGRKWTEYGYYSECVVMKG